MPGTKIEMIKDKPSDRRDYRINCSKIKNIIGWKAKFSVTEGVKEIIDKLNYLDLNWEDGKYRNSSFEYI